MKVMQHISKTRGTEKPSMTSLAWLEELNQAILQTRCRVGNRLVSLQEGLDAVPSLLEELRRADGALWWVGNGGSAALCAHLSQDALNKLGVRSMVLADAPLLTCMANDYGYSKVYEQPLGTLARKGDMLICVSSSGRSENILRCAKMARQRSMKLVTLSAFAPKNPLWGIEADVAFHIPTTLFGQAEVGHEALLHSAMETMMLREGG